MARRLRNGLLIVQHLASLPTDPEAPTQAEITAGTGVIGAQGGEELFEIEGFVLESTDLPMPGFHKITVPTLPGPQNYPTSRLSFYEDDTTKTLETLFADGSSGFLAFMREGIGATNDVTIYGYSVGSNEPRWVHSVVAIFDVNLSITERHKGTQAA